MPTLQPLPSSSPPVLHFGRCSSTRKSLLNQIRQPNQSPVKPNLFPPPPSIPGETKPTPKSGSLCTLPPDGFPRPTPTGTTSLRPPLPTASASPKHRPISANGAMVNFAPSTSSTPSTASQRSSSASSAARQAPASSPRAATMSPSSKSAEPSAPPSASPPISQTSTKALSIWSWENHRTQPAPGLWINGPPGTTAPPSLCRSLTQPSMRPLRTLSPSIRSSHSVRNACIGSIREALRAGINPATAAEASNTAIAIPRLAGSYDPTL